jgi:hypothetical protein
MTETAAYIFLHLLSCKQPEAMWASILMLVKGIYIR